jgi:enterochelin esterase-like enzyme
MMPILAFAALALAAASPSFAVDDKAVASPRLAALQQALKDGDHDAPTRFWQQVAREGTPLIEPAPGECGRMRVTFLWEAGSAHDDLNVGVLGPFNQDDPPAARRLIHLADTTVWYRTYALDTAARLSYSLAWPAGRTSDAAAIRKQAQDGTAYELFADPKCRRSYVGVFFDENKPYSYAEGPDAPPEPWMAARPAVSQGRLVTFPFRSQILSNTRDITVYLPPGYRSDGEPYPFLLLFDANSYLQTATTPTLLDNMIADGAIPPLVAIFVGRIDRAHRNRELPPNPDFARFVAEELLPAVRRDHHITSSPDQAVIGGASYGALAATAIAQRYPEAFGNVLSQSGSYWWHPGFGDPDKDAFREQMGFLPRTFATGPKLPLRFYLEVGAWEGSSMVLPNRFLRDLLLARGYDVDYHEFVGGHDFINWRGSLPRALIWLLGGPRR